MFEKLNQLAHHAATDASRRQFLSRLGKAALGVAAAAAGLLALPGEAHGAQSKARCCYYRCGGRGGASGVYVCHADGSACGTKKGCTLRSQTLVNNCDRCRGY